MERYKGFARMQKPLKHSSLSEKQKNKLCMLIRIELKKIQNFEDPKENKKILKLIFVHIYFIKQNFCFQHQNLNRFSH